MTGKATVIFPGVQGFPGAVGTLKFPDKFYSSFRPLFALIGTILIILMP